MINIFRKQKKFSGAGFKNLSSIPAAAGVIPSANLPVSGGSDLVKWVSAAEMTSNTGGVATEPFIGIRKPAVTLGASGTSDAELSTKIPAGATSISSIVLIFVGLGTGDMIIAINSSIISTTADVAPTTDTNLANQTVTIASTSVSQRFTVPAGAYDGITIAANNILNLLIKRLGDDAGDVNASSAFLLGALITFA